MSNRDLTKIFLATGIATALVAGVGALAFSAEWALRYTLVGFLSLLNWVALAAIFSGLSRRNLLPLIIGLMVKPLLVLGYLALGTKGLIEMTSFLAGMNTFFVVMFVWMFSRRFIPGKRAPKAPAVSEVYG